MSFGDELVSFFKGAKPEKEEQEPLHTQASPLRKRLIFGTILSRQASQTITQAD